MASERFFALPLEKQARLVNAGFKVFGLNEYKKASTEDIAREAGISKGYLFYYFQNKKALYLFLYDKAIEITRQQVLDSGFHQITDFFEMMAYAARRKARLSADYPFLTEFVLRAFSSLGEEVSGSLQKKILADTDTSYQEAFRSLNLSPFKPEVDPFYLMRLLYFFSSGYLTETQRERRKPTVEEMMAEFDRMLSLMKKLCYREEYQ